MKAAVVIDRLQMAVVIVTLSVILLPCGQSSGQTLHRRIEADQPISTHAICRHGDRNIYTKYPTDPWNAPKYWPGGYYALTEVGKKELFTLGQYFRKRYGHLVGAGEHVADKIYVQSTDKPRTIMSGRSVLAGLFSLDTSSNWESIPIHVVPLKDDYILAVEKKCDRFDYLMMEYAKTTAYKRLFEENKQLIEYVEKHSGFQLRSLTNINDLYDTFLVERIKNFRFPSWAEDVMKKNGPFEAMSLQWYVTFTSTTELKKLRSGYLLAEMLNHFTHKDQPSFESQINLWMYFAHDITISNMLNSLGLFELHLPPYASCIFIELYRQGPDENQFVQIFYRNTTETNVPPLHIPNCGTKCPLNRFYELYDDILPKRSIDEECGLHNGEILVGGGNPESNSL